MSNPVNMEGPSGGQAPQAPQPNYAWYIIHVAAGSENKISQEMGVRMEKAGLGHRLTDIVVPKKQDVALKKGSKIMVEDRIWPGYILVRLDYSPEVIHVIRRVPRVIGFLGVGSSGVPQALGEEEVKGHLERLSLMGESVRDSLHFEVGERVKICDGLFSSWEGVVEGVDLVRLRLTLSISILGRATPLELEFSQVQKVLEQNS